MSQDLTSEDSHFAFGKNWASYAANIDKNEIDEAKLGLQRLLGADSVQGKQFLDIGCGSGLHSLAALELGAKRVLAVDLDQDSISTTQSLLDKHCSNNEYRVSHTSVFELDSLCSNKFDVVYSWGVLHHTGDMYKAMRCAAEQVNPNGKFIFALYRKTWLCNFWKWEKRWYANTSSKAQEHARKVFINLFRLGLFVTGRNFSEYVNKYYNNRGMDYIHDVHDWMGGYPYESITPEQVEQTMSELGFEKVDSFVSKGKVLGLDVGLFGSGCDEYIYTRL